MSTLLQDQQQRYPSEIDIFGRENPFSIINLVPPEVREKFFACRNENPEYFQMTEAELFKELRRQKARPNSSDNRLKLKFWLEYDRTFLVEPDKKLNISNIIAGICSRELFYNHYLRRPKKVAWLLCPPDTYEMKYAEALNYALDQLRDILEQPHIDKRTKEVQQGVAQLKLRVFRILENRRSGTKSRATPHQYDIREPVGELHDGEEKELAGALLDMSEEYLARKLHDLTYTEKKMSEGHIQPLVEDKKDE